jgi:pimeloyl-ACP methyl ester carboxylesterase
MPPSGGSPSLGISSDRTGAVPALIAALALAVAVLLSAGTHAAGAASEPRMQFDKRMRMQSVCFTVTNPSGGQSTLYGQRITDGPVSSLTPAIVLVHGIASSTANWDFSPTWSVARGLAKAGYVVFSYDRLGYAKSNYFDHPGGGYTLTTSAHRMELHQIVGEVKSGGYSTTVGDCSGAKQPSTMTNRLVVIIGHSAGGWIVAGYPGEFHDVAAMIQMSISGSLWPSTTSSPFGDSSGGGFTTDPSHPDYFQFFQTRQNCEDFNTYPPGAVRYVVDIACAPPFLLSPWGEIAALGEMYAENDAFIKLIGPSIPVLLASGDHDTTAPPSTARNDYDYYRANCGCDVTQWIIPDTAHLFMVHRSLPAWIDYVVGWLKARGLPPAR